MKGVFKKESSSTGQIETHLNDKREPHAQSYSFRHDEIIAFLVKKVVIANISNG
ncbi:hypothetical protein RO3G_17412 [Rhizopus delemar RA 99-880]|uniref:Uncharacterized protein n=1 Tax=Rhizopus delemar (strain RA 99-880 / ATCC MYA-4621 / FGSC 9543 / NRRL 43880) TaxID=246409 RepID=I1CW70_RHIO9|nr:hypothetical protein RO3G_17412 [Rhizopus delemar RA 99-880]|eukprot:EIE92700.1 hypothetical protein RO3G_17412 [Rhizopus delemar RA 99-880]